MLTPELTEESQTYQVNSLNKAVEIAHDWLKELGELF